MAWLRHTTTAFVPPIRSLHPTTAAAAIVSPSTETEPLLSTIAIVSPTQLLSTISSSAQLTATTDAQASSSSQIFEAVAPDISLLLGFGSVVVLCIAAGFVWANDVVPVSRTKLAISKSRGEVREYLDDLKINDGISLGDSDATTMVPDSEQEEGIDENSQPNAVEDGRGFERWLFSDWLNDKPGMSGGRRKEPALPILKKAKWNSGDNPVLVTVAIMMLGVIVASVTERIAT